MREKEERDRQGLRDRGRRKRQADRYREMREKEERDRQGLRDRGRRKREIDRD